MKLKNYILNSEFWILNFLIRALLMSFPLVCVAEESDPIVVRLATESQLLPLYLSNFYEEQPGFDSTYVKKLENILNFDLSHNGMTLPVPHTSDRESQARKESFDQAPNAQAWKALNVFYVIKARVKNKSLSIQMLAVNNGAIKSIDNLSLTGNLNQDRRQIHQVADLIHKALFGTDGVATTRILYTLKRHDSANSKLWTSDVWESDYDGGNARQVTHDGGYCVTPVYLPPKPGHNSANFFYVSYQTGQPKIYLASLKDGTTRRLTLVRGNQLMPAISRQRDQVAFICDITGNPDLFLQPFTPEAGAIGKPRQIFATHLATQGTPSFSPDGKKIAFVSNKDGSPRIYVMDVPAEGTLLKNISAKLITKHNSESSAPAWSPDGKKIAYCSKSNGIRQIWIYDFTTKQETQLTQGAGNKENPTWAPNSLHLVYNSSDAGASELYLINLNQPQATKISSGSGEKHFPNWEPREFANK
jgi:TolB protein